MAEGKFNDLLTFVIMNVTGYSSANQNLKMLTSVKTV